MAVTSFAAMHVGLAVMTLRVYQLNKKSGISCMDELAHPIKCGVELYSEGRLSFESVDEITDVLKEFQLKLLEYGIENAQLYVASSLGEAKNIEFVLNQIRLKTGLKPKLLNNSKERYLMLQSIARSMPNFNEVIQKGTLILEIGYGSVQITIYDQSSLIATQNISIGLQRITEFLSRVESRTSHYPELISEYLKSDMEEFKRLYLQKVKIENFIVVGREISHLNTLQKQNGFGIYTLDDLKAIHERFSKHSMLELSNQYDLPYEQVKLMSPLYLILKGFFEMSSVEQMYCPDVHICDGIVTDYGYKKLGIFSGHHFTEDRLSGAKHLAERFGCDMVHNEYVAKVAKILFKALAKPYGLTNKDSQILELASILHNCGRYVNLHFEDDLSYHIVKESEFINLSDTNRDLIACVLKYKNREFPAYRELNEPSLNNDYYVILARLTAIFRIAEALDDCHLQKMTNIKAVIKGDEFVIRATSYMDILIEESEFEESSKLFVEVFGLKPVLKCKRSV